ncbi:MAG: site-specific DNA-methyltransferase [Bacteroidota bacterium]
MIKFKLAYKTNFGRCYNGKVEDALKSKVLTNKKNKVNLIFTSPPFPLNRKKKYGNLNGEEYTKWLTNICRKLSKLLTTDGSLVIEIGNAWEPSQPVMSSLPLKTLLSILEKSNLYLCQQFIWYNNAKLPSPAQWVNIERIRVKDSFTIIWWMSKTTKPKADNRKILIEYSTSMKKLLDGKKYNSGKRPSEHVIGDKSFLINNNGAIPSNVLIGGNTESSSKYITYCKKKNIEIHPARMPKFIPEFFIKFLSEPGDLVLYPFSGSNTTGEAAEKLRRKWLAIEINNTYISGSKGRFKLLTKK